MKDKLKQQVYSWAPKLAFLAVFGFTGIAAMALYSAVRAIEKTDLEITEDDWKRGQQ